jgi:AbrB family looped-hinge helix DNA binding protein
VITTIDKAGRIVVPKALREALHLLPGSVLQIEQQEDHIVVRTPSPDVELVRKDGMLAVRYKCPLTRSIQDFIAEDREDRIRSFIRGFTDEKG